MFVSIRTVAASMACVALTPTIGHYVLDFLQAPGSLSQGAGPGMIT